MIEKIKQELVDVSKLLYEKRHVVGKGGNVSVRFEDKVYITASGVSLHDLTFDLIAEYSLTKHCLENSVKPSSELLLHIGIYQKREDIRYIIHAHPIKLTAYALAGIELNYKLIPEIYVSFGKIPLIKYENPSSQELSDSVSSVCAEHEALLLQNHGVVVMDQGSLMNAYYKLETLEAFAETCLYAHMLGDVNEIPPEQLKVLRQLYSPSS